MLNIFAGIQMPLHLNQDHNHIEILSENNIRIISINSRFILLAEFLVDILNTFIEDTHCDKIKFPISNPLPYSVNDPLAENIYLIDSKGVPIFGEHCIADRDTVLFVAKACNRYLQGKWISYIPEPNNYYWVRFLGDSNKSIAICFVREDNCINLIDTESSISLSAENANILNGQIEFYSIALETPEDV